MDAILNVIGTIAVLLAVAALVFCVGCELRRLLRDDSDSGMGLRNFKTWRDDD